MLVGVLFVLVGVLFVFSQGNVKHFGARDRPKRYAKKHVGTQKNTSGQNAGGRRPKGVLFPQVMALSVRAPTLYALSRSRPSRDLKNRTFAGLRPLPPTPNWEAPMIFHLGGKQPCSHA